MVWGRRCCSDVMFFWLVLHNTIDFVASYYVKLWRCKVISHLPHWFPKTLNPKNGVMSSFDKSIKLCEVLPKLWKYVKFCQKYGVMSSFAKNIELCQILPRFKVCQKYGVVLSLPKLWKYVKFCQKYGIVPSFC